MLATRYFMVVEKTQQLYELSFHLLATLEEGDIAREVDTIRGLIERHGGVLVRQQQPERSTLAYTIVRKLGGKNEQNAESYFGVVVFEGEPAAAVALDEALRDMSSVLRFLLTVVPREAIEARERRVPRTNQEQMTQSKTPVTSAPEMSKQEIDEEIEKLVVE